MSQDILKRMVLFKELDDNELVEILSLCVTKKYPAKSVIFADGDPANKIYLIREGEVRISKMIPGMGEEALAVLKAGNFFGEMSLIDENVRSAYATAQTNCILMEIVRDDFLDLLNKNGDIARKFLWEFCRILTNRLRATNERFYGLFAMSGFFK